MIDPEEVKLQAKVFRDAAAASPILPVAAVFKKRAKECERAVADYELSIEMGNRAQIEFVGMIEPGMTVIGVNPAEVIRVLNQGGQISLHLNEDGASRYYNYLSGSSPVCVVV